MARKNIAGIHNYCDRWCERCAFTSRCAVFESESKTTPEQQDLANKAFWERLSENFAKARTMLEQKAEEFGIDLSANVDEITKNEEDLRIKSQRHRIIQIAQEYATFSRNWLKTQPGMMEKLEKLKEEITIGLESHEGVKLQAETIKDCLAVIQWYIGFMEAKFMRALMGKMDDMTSGPDEEYPRDYDGSAKIGMIAIDRSMQAWAKLFDLLPQQEDEFLRALSLLEKMKSHALSEFPDAMKFIRPGFDDQLT